MDPTVEEKNCIDKIIDLLQSMFGSYGGCDGFDLSTIEEEGRYLKTLFECASKWSSSNQQSSISRIESAFYVDADSLYSRITGEEKYRESESKRFRAESERFRAESEWYRAESERVRAESEAESESLRAQSEWLREWLRAEYELLRAESERFRDKFERVRAESEGFRADKCRRTSKLFKQPIWGLYSSMFESRSCDGDNGLKNRLKVDLKVLKTFFLFAFRQENLEYPTDPTDPIDPIDDDYNYSPQAPDLDYSQFERDFAPLYDHGKQFFCLLISEEEGLSYYQELAEEVSMFRVRIQGFNQLICEWYIRISHKKWTHDFIIRSDEEFMKPLLALLECVEDIIICGVEANDTSTFKTMIEPLKGRLTFLRNCIFLVIFTGFKFCFEDLLDDSRVAAIDAARLCCICWFYSYRDDDDQLLHEISVLVRRLEGTNRTFHHRYHNFLGSSRYQEISFTQLIEPDLDAVGIFVDSLLSKLWLLLSSSTGIAVSTRRHEMEMLAEGLKFLTTILKKQQQKLHVLRGETKNLIKDVICCAGNLIPSLSSLDHPLKKEAVKARINLEGVRLLENIKLIKAELGTKSPMSTFNFSAANELEFIDIILENLEDLPSHKFDSIPSGNEVRADLLSLRSFLETIQGHCDHNGELQTLWNQVIEVAYEVEFAIDSLIAEDISPYSLMLFDYIAKEIMHVKNEAIKIGDLKFVKTSSHVPSQGTISLIKDKSHETAKTSRSVPAQGTISQINDVVVGFDDEAKAIIDQLTRGSMELDVVFVTGMPGLGKTTLAKMVYHDSSVMHHFHIRAWCSVSQVWCRKDLLLEILHCIVPEHSNQDYEKDEDDLAEKLCKSLKGYRYLIVLDDVWDIEAWNDLESSFPNDAKGSRVLLTGRHHLLIKPTVEPYRLRRLSDDECWELLQKKLVHKVDFSPSLCDIGRRIAKNCNGLPLSAVIIAGILANLKQSDWEEVAMSSNILCGTEECMHILELSYRHLPNYLKPCLLYFGAFLEDQEIHVNKLMWLWIAEGFLQKNDLKSLEDTAEDCIMALISRNLVMVAKQGSLGTVKTCRIHDLLHVFCQVKSKEHNFLHLIRGDEELFDFDEPHKLRRLRMYSQPTHFEKWRLFYPRIRSLLFFSCGAGNQIKSYNLSYIFHRKLLRVLDLGQINLGMIFPCEITMLVQLRFLAVLGWMKDVPESIANLSNLETFLVTTNLFALKGFSLPNALWDMQRLRHLHVHGCLVDFSCRENSSNLDNLDTVSTPKLCLGQSMEKIMKKFPNIRKLKCCIAESEEPNGDSNKIVVINFPSRLESLKLILGNVDVLHVEFNFPSSLKKLTLSDFSWSMISTIRKLSNLEVLKLLKGAVHEAGTWDMKKEEFPNLKILKLYYSDIVIWTSSGDHHFPCLENLVLEGCKKLVELPSCLEDISTLDLIKVHRCLENVGSLVREIEEEHKKWRSDKGLKIVITEEVEEDLYFED